jgi:HNH endonuclease
VTHPILGPASWKEMWTAAEKLRAGGKRICTWCHEEIPNGRRSRCGAKGCSEHIWQATSWRRCRALCLRRDRFCPCGARATEADHRVPVCLGGLSDQGNLRGLCHACHLEATARLRREGKDYVA